MKSTPKAESAKKDIARQSTEIPEWIIRSPESFEMLFNHFLKELDSPYRAINPKITKNENGNGTISYTLAKNLGLVGTLNADDEITTMIVIFGGKGQADGADLLLAATAIMYSTNPTLLPDERGEILRSLGLFDEGIDLTDFSRTTFRNGIKYFFQSNTLTGVWFGAQKLKK
jgi:hypothetical protein